MATSVNTPSHKKKRGPKPGTKHKGMFVKGDPRISPPKKGDFQRPGIKKEFMALMRGHTDRAVQCLLDCMDDEKAPWREKIAAAELTLAHGHGRPVDRLAVQTLNEEGGSQVQNMDYQALRAKAALYLAKYTTDEDIALITQNETAESVIDVN